MAHRWRGRKSRVLRIGVGCLADVLHPRPHLGPDPREHLLELVSFTDDVRNGVFADLALRYTDGTVSALVSDTDWRLHDGSYAVPLRGRSFELVSCYAAVRPHPLVGAHWLAGDIELGAPTLQFSSTAHDSARIQVFRFDVPAGTTGFSCPTTHPVTVSVDGHIHCLANGLVDLGSPLQQLSTVVVTSLDPVRFGAGGSFWTGPIVVRTAMAPMPFGDLRQLGLGSWSGGIRYSRRSTSTGGAITLDLGRVRGSVTVEVDGHIVGTAFCQPYTFEVGDHLRTMRPVADQRNSDAPDDHEITVTLYNTLAPYLYEASPSPWTFPSQLESGVLGPVTLTIERTGPPDLPSASPEEN